MARPNPEPLTPRAYHARRLAARLAERESLRQRWLLAAREAIRRLAPAEPSSRAAYLFGSLVRPEPCFTERSDIDVAVDCADPEAESRFWRARCSRTKCPLRVHFSAERKRSCGFNPKVR